MINNGRTFVREDTGEKKEFTPVSYRNGTTTMHSKEYEEFADFHCFKSEDGDRIDRMGDGRYQDKYGTVWLPESTH